jgi:predicted MFS family arabinose efflux permease
MADGVARRVLPLGAGTFAVGTGLLAIQGVLPAIAADLGVSTVEAGQLVTAFAIVYALGAPLLAVAAVRVPPRPLLIGALLIFALANVGGALAPTLPVLLATRVLAALASALFTPNATATGASLVPDDRRGRAIALVYGGLSVATVLGVPAGTLLGGVAGWRATFWFVALLAVLSAAWLAAAMPNAPRPAPAGVDLLLAVARRPGVARTVAVTTVLMTGQFVAFTFIAPLVERAAGAPGPATVAGALFLFGVAAVGGNAVGGIATDRVGAHTTVAVSLAGFALALAGLAAAIQGGGAEWAIFAGAIALAVWGVAGYAFVPAQQRRLLRAAPDAGGVVLSLNASALNAGIALGGALGGAVLGGAGLAALPLVGAAFGAVALVLVLREHGEPAPMPAMVPAAATIGPPADCVPGWGPLPCPAPPASAPP